MKLLIKLSVAIIALLLLVIGLLLMLVDPNDYKNEIQIQVKNSINRDLHINGDISWGFYPQLGFTSGEIELDNLSNFDKPHLLKIERASVGIDIFPLLKGEISIGKLTLDGFELTLITNKNGLSNLDNMTGQSTEKDKVVKTEKTTGSPSATPQSEDSFFQVNKAQLAGININNAQIEIEDLQAGSYQKVIINEIKLGQFSLDKETELSINTQIVIDDIQAQIELNSLLIVNNELSNIKLNKLQIDTLLTANALPNGQLESQLKADINFAVESKRVSIKQLDINTRVNADNLPNKKITTQINADIDYLLDNQLATIKSLQLKVDDIELTGEMSVQTGNITKVRYDLVGNNWDINRYLAESEATKVESSSATSEKSQLTSTNTKKQNSTETEPDLSFLNNLDVDGKLKIAGAKVKKIKIGEIKNRLIIKNGKAKVAPLTAELYQGLLTVNGEVNESKGRNKYKISTKLNDVQVHQLLIDAADLDIISGTTNFTFNGKGEGLTATKIKQALAGKGNFSLLDGELYGVNLSQEIRIIKAKLKGKSVPTSDSIKKTDFASLKGDFSIAKGLVNNQKLLMLSPAVRLDGAGLVHIINETLDYKLSISPLSSSKEETDYVDLTGITIPMLIKGSFTNPKISLDTDGALKEYLKATLKAEEEHLKQKAQEALNGELDSKSLKEEGKRLKDKLKSFF